MPNINRLKYLIDAIERVENNNFEMKTWPHDCRTYMFSLIWTAIDSIQGSEMRPPCIVYECPEGKERIYGIMDACKFFDISIEEGQRIFIPTSYNYELEMRRMVIDRIKSLIGEYDDR